MTFYLGHKQAAEQLGITSATLYVWRHNGRGPAYHKRGGKVWYNPKDIEAFNRAGRVETVDSINLLDQAE